MALAELEERWRRSSQGRNILKMIKPCAEPKATAQTVLRDCQQKDKDSPQRRLAGPQSEVDPRDHSAAGPEGNHGALSSAGLK